ncbi:MAG TPA: hypothetical protein VFX49_13860 [Chloroflexota bacterium]|nr:hypothetical protein [Chloroflexota bacterium]
MKPSRKRAAPNRGHREGSLFQFRRTGAAKEKPTGRWRGELMVGWKYFEEDGERRKIKDVRVVYGETRQQVLDRLVVLKGTKMPGSLVEPSRLTFGEYVAWWLDNVVRVRRTPHTFETYEGNMRHHVLPDGEARAAAHGLAARPGAPRRSGSVRGPFSYVLLQESAGGVGAGPGP